MWKAETLEIRLFGRFGPKSGLLRQKGDQLRSIFKKGLLPDQGLIQRTSLAALILGNYSVNWLNSVVFETIIVLSGGQLQWYLGGNYSGIFGKYIGNFGKYRTITGK